MIQKEITGDILGLPTEKITVNGRDYPLLPPTIGKLAGAGHHLAGIPDLQTLGDIISVLPHLAGICKALSWLVAGDESLYKEFTEGTAEEVVNGLIRAVSLVGIENFARLSALARNVRSLVAITR